MGYRLWHVNTEHLNTQQTFSPKPYDQFTLWPSCLEASFRLNMYTFTYMDIFRFGYLQQHLQITNPLPISQHCLSAQTVGLRSSWVRLRRASPWECGRSAPGNRLWQTPRKLQWVRSYRRRHQRSRSSSSGWGVYRAGWFWAPSHQGWTDMAGHTLDPGRGCHWVHHPGNLSLKQQKRTMVGSKFICLLWIMVTLLIVRWPT